MECYECVLHRQFITPNCIYFFILFIYQLSISKMVVLIFELTLKLDASCVVLV